MPTVENEWSSLCRRLLQVSDLLDQVVLLIGELLIIRPLFLEIAQKLDELGLVFQQDLHDGLRFVWTGHKNLHAHKAGTAGGEEGEEPSVTALPQPQLPSHAGWQSSTAHTLSQGTELRMCWFNATWSKAVPACGAISPLFYSLLIKRLIANPAVESGLSFLSLPHMQVLRHLLIISRMEKAPCQL